MKLTIKTKLLGPTLLAVTGVMSATTLHTMNTVTRQLNAIYDQELQVVVGSVLKTVHNMAAESKTTATGIAGNPDLAAVLLADKADAPARTRTALHTLERPSATTTSRKAWCWTPTGAAW